MSVFNLIVVLAICVVLLAFIMALYEKIEVLRSELLVVADDMKKMQAFRMVKKDEVMCGNCKHYQGGAVGGCDMREGFLYSMNDSCSNFERYINE